MKFGDMREGDMIINDGIVIRRVGNKLVTTKGGGVFRIGETYSMEIRAHHEIRGWEYVPAKENLFDTLYKRMTS